MNGNIQQTKQFLSITFMIEIQDSCMFQVVFNDDLLLVGKTFSLVQEVLRLLGIRGLGDQEINF